MSSRHLKNQLKDLRSISPSPSWLSAHRELLMAQIRAQSERPEQVSRAASWGEKLRQALFVVETVFTSIASAIFARGAASLALAVVLLLATGGYAVTAAEDSIPGERLYGLKIAVENLRLRAAASAKSKVELQTEFAARRLEELVKLTTNDGARLPEAEILVSQFETSVKDIASAASQISSTSPDKAVEIAKIVDGKIGEYESSLKATGGVSKSPDLSRRVSKALSTVNKAGTEALKVIVNQGAPSEPEKIAGKLNDKIQKSEERLRLADAKLEGGAKTVATSSAKDISADAKINIAEAKKKITEGDYQAALVILDKVEDMVEEVADSAETTIDENTGSGTQNTEGEVKGENTSIDDESGQSTNPTGTTIEQSAPAN